jgi:alpha-N-arabinofuranosidase
LALSGVKARGAAGSVLTAQRLDAHNDFTHPAAVTPAKLTAQVHGESLIVELPARSVAVLEVLQ